MSFFSAFLPAFGVFSRGSERLVTPDLTPYPR